MSYYGLQCIKMPLGYRITVVIEVVKSKKKKEEKRRKKSIFFQNKRVTLSELQIIGIWDMADHTLWVECMLAPNTVG